MSSWLRQTAVRFATVGVFNTLLTIVVIFSLKAFAGTPDLWANATGYVIGLISSFALNKRWTFQHEDRVLPAAVKFVGVFALSYLLNIITVLTLIGIGFNDYLAHLVGMPVYTIAFYFGCLLFAFRRPSGDAPAVAQAGQSLPAVPLVWCAILLGIVALKLYPAWEPLRTNDSYQYLSVAENFQHGMVGRTSLVHFDEERASGIVPVPTTTFPIGYPLLVGVFEATGLSVERAALIVSLLAALGSIFLLDVIGRQIALSPTARHWVLAIFVASSWTPVFATAALSESAFTFMTLGALALLIAALRSTDDEGSQTALAIAAGIAFGLSYWLRYAGLFVLLGLVPVIALALALKRRHTVRPVLIAFCLGGLTMAAGMVRNILLVGTWRGGNTKVIDHSAVQIAHEFGVAIRDLLFGAPRMAEWLFLRGLLFLMIAAGCVAGVVFWRRASRAGQTPFRIDFAASILGIVTITYLTCLTYAAAQTGISYGARYFFPVFPIVLLLLALAITQVEQRIPAESPRRQWRGIATAIAGSYALLHLSLFYLEPLPALHDQVAQRLDTRISDDLTARQAILSLAGPDGVVMANVGQATGYVLQRPMVSLIGSHLGSVEWSEANVRETMKRFAVKTLVVHKPGPDDVANPFPSPFIERLATGDAPGWLQRVGASEAVVIYRPDASP